MVGTPTLRVIEVDDPLQVTLTVIREEFEQETVPFAQICDIVEGAIIKRRAMGRNYGVAVLAEGVIEKLDPKELADADKRNTWVREEGAMVLSFINPQNPFEVVDVFLEEPMPFKILEAQVVSQSFVTILSLIEMGTPKSDPLVSGLPCERRRLESKLI